MSSDDCIKAYTKLADQVFVKEGHRLSLMGKFQARYNSVALESAVNSIAAAAELDENMLLWDLDPKACKV